MVGPCACEIGEGRGEVNARHLGRFKSLGRGTEHITTFLGDADIYLSMRRLSASPEEFMSKRERFEGRRARTLVGASVVAVALAAAGVLGGVGFAKSSPTAAQYQYGKVTICHKTRSKKNPSVTITISQSALPAHLRRGDTVGACVTATTPTTTTTTAAVTSAPGGSGEHGNAGGNGSGGGNGNGGGHGNAGKGPKK
jgi:hypothetical protein